MARPALPRFMRAGDSMDAGVIVTSKGLAKSSVDVELMASGVTVKGAATVTIEGTSVAVGGAGGEPLIKGATFLSMFNAHTHVCTAPGSPSGPPIPPLTPAVLTTKSTAS